MQATNDTEASYEEVRDSIERRTEVAIHSMIAKGIVDKPRMYSPQTIRFVLFLALLLLTVAWGYRYQEWLLAQPSSPALPNGATLVTAVFAGLASAFGFFQWMDARQENSQERFYDRLEIITEQYMKHTGARSMVPHFWRSNRGEDDWEGTLYVYLEIDNLEYMMTRYRKGYVPEELFRRSVRTFVSRCDSQEFRQLVVKLVRRAGHNPKTVSVVDLIATLEQPQLARSSAIIMAG